MCSSIQLSNFAVYDFLRGFLNSMSSTPAADDSVNTDEDNLTETLRSNLTRLIAYAKSADPALQRQVAERLANEAVKRE